ADSAGRPSGAAPLHPPACSTGFCDGSSARLACGGAALPMGARLIRQRFSKICLDTYIRVLAYCGHGIGVRNYCGAEPASDLEPAGLVGAVGGRDRAAAGDDAAGRIEASAGAARSWFRGVHGGCTTPSLPAEAGAVQGSGSVAGAVPAVLGRTRGRSGTTP